MSENDLLKVGSSAWHELEIGRQIQASFLPGALPQPAGWQIAAALQPAREVGGDFYDAFALSGGKRLGLVMADVCDKGVGAALFMALFRSLIRAFADQHYSLGWMDVLSGAGGAQANASDTSAVSAASASVGQRRSRLSAGSSSLKNAIDLTNKYIAQNHGDTSMFATVFFGVLDPATGALVYINAGHEPPIVFDPDDGNVKHRLGPTGPVVGLFDGAQFGIAEYELAPGNTLLACTDGVLDARDPQGGSFGQARLLAALTGEAAPDKLIERIDARIAAHTAGASQYDDITLLAVRRLPTP